MEEETKNAGNEVTITVNKWVLVVIGVVFALGLGLGGGYLVLRQGPGPVTSVAVSPTSSALATTPTPDIAAVPSAYLAQPVSAEEMFSEFVCSCCGQLIGDCTCGMAGERRGFVTGVTSVGKNKLELYLAYADQYGLDAFASEEARQVVKDYKLANAPQERPQIALAQQTVALGDVSAQEGAVEISVTLRNTGQEDLVVDGLSTSCGCTTVSVINAGQEGPAFGPGAPSEEWSTTIRPGETAELRIYYDPNFHEGARGAIVREVYVSSNDPIDPVVKVSIELNQVD